MAVRRAMPAIPGLVGRCMAGGGRWLGQGCACARPWGVRGAAWRCVLWEARAGGASGIFTPPLLRKKARGVKRPVRHCLLSPRPLCGSGSWLLFQGFWEVGAKERCLSSPPASSSIARMVDVVSGSAHHRPGSSPLITGEPLQKHNTSCASGSEH